MPYPEESMSPSQARFPAPSARFVIGLLLLGSLAGIILVLLEAPLWTFYVAPLLAVPWLLHELRSLEGDGAEEGRPAGRLRSHVVSGNRFQHAWFLYLRNSSDLHRTRRRYRGFTWALFGAGATLLVGLWLSSSLAWWSGLLLIAPALLLLMLRALSDMASGGLHYEESLEHGELKPPFRSVPSGRLEVFPCEGEWAIRSPGEPWTMPFEDQESAREAAADYLREHGGGELILRGHEGTICERETIGDGDATGRVTEAGTPLASEPPPATAHASEDRGIEEVSRDTREQRARLRKRRAERRRKRPR